MKYSCLYIEGPIGAGKSTLSEIIVRRLKELGYDVVLVSEPVDEWEESGIFKEFYDDMAGKSYEFQTTTFITRVTKIINTFKEVSQRSIREQTESKHIVFVVERSIYSDRYFFAENLHDNGLISDYKFEFYKQWWNLWERILNFDNMGFLYLKPSHTECMMRCKERGRENEKVLSDYQQQLIDRHNKMFPDKYGNATVDSENGHINIPYMTIEDDRDFRDNVESKNKVQDDIFDEFMGWFKNEIFD